MGVLVSLKNDAQSDWHPSLSDIKNNTKTMSQAKKRHVQPLHFRNRTL